MSVGPDEDRRLGFHANPVIEEDVAERESVPSMLRAMRERIDKELDAMERLEKESARRVVLESQLGEAERTLGAAKAERDALASKDVLDRAEIDKLRGEVRQAAQQVERAGKEVNAAHAVTAALRSENTQSLETIRKLRDEVAFREFQMQDVLRKAGDMVMCTCGELRERKHVRCFVCGSDQLRT